MESQFRDICENLAAHIKTLDGIKGNSAVTVIVEDKGDIESQIAEALGYAGVVIMIGVLGFDRRQQSGELITGNLKLELRVMERPAVNRNEQGYITAQQMIENLILSLHWARIPGMLGPLLFNDFSRDDTAELDLIRGSFAGECSLGMVRT